MTTPYFGHYSYILKDAHRDVFRIILYVLVLFVLVFSGWAYSVMFGVSASPEASVVQTKPSKPAKPIFAETDRGPVLTKPTTALPIFTQPQTVLRRTVLDKPSSVPPLR